MWTRGFRHHLVPEEIRGDGHPLAHHGFDAAEKNGAIIPELAADAHDCIMVRSSVTAEYKAVAEVFAISCKFPSDRCPPSAALFQKRR